MKCLQNSRLAALQWVRDAFADYHMLLCFMFVRLLQVHCFFQIITNRTAFDIFLRLDALGFDAAIAGIRFIDRSHQQLRSAAAALRRFASRLLCISQAWALRFAVRLIVWIAVLAFQTAIFGARLQAAIHKRQRALDAAARPAGALLLARLRAIRAELLPRLVSSAPNWRPVVAVLLFCCIIGLAFLRPTQAKAPDLPTPVVIAWSADMQATPTPYQPIAATATPIPTQTATATPTQTPTVHVTAVTWFQGPRVCGVVDGIPGTGTFVWPSVEHRTGGFNFAPAYGHRGIDVAGDYGNDIYAADSGVVIYAGWHPGGYGNLLVLDHGNGYQTVYAHLTRWFVECADLVEQGDTIGAMGSTGFSYGPHLHFEVITTRGEYLNPWLFLEAE